MRNLLLFFKKSATFFEFLLLEIVAFLLIMQNEGYQSNVMLSACNRVVATTYRVIDSVEDYFSLSTENQLLVEENVRLQERIIALESALAASSFQKESLMVFENTYDFIAAKTIYNTVDNIQNYLIIDKGTDDGIEAEMGVVDRNGVVGIVKTSSNHFSMVLPILNVQSRLSCRIGRGGTFGSLVWNAVDSRYAMLEEIPRHVAVECGDSVFTSGLSVVFPEGFLVGIIDDVHLGENSANYELKIKLACDFRSVNYVKVVRFANKQEYEELKTED